MRKPMKSKRTGGDITTIRDIAIAFGYEIDKKSEAKANQSIQTLKSTATKILGAIGIGFSMTQINAIAEEFNGINNQIRNATQSLGDQNEIQQKILETANETRTEYGYMGKMVSNLVQSNKDLFGNVDEAAKFAEVTTKLFKTAGKSNEEISSIQEAMNKSFAKGVVESETLNQLYERAPEAINLISQSLGVANKDLLKLASDGKISLTNLKNAFVNNADIINSGFSGLNYSISDAMLHVRNEWGLFIDGFNSTFGITQMIAKGIVKVSNIAMNVMRKVQTWIERISKSVGGVNNLIKLLAIAAGSIFIAFNFSKITSFLSSIMKMMGGINIKALAIAAVIALIALLIDDFINFMKGNDSVIGELFKKAGIDADEVRKKIIGAWNKIKGFLLKAWTGIKNTGKKIWDGLKSFWAKNGESIKQGFVKAWKAISSTLITLWGIIKAIAINIFGKLKTFWDENGEKIKDVFRKAWIIISARVIRVWNKLKTRATEIFEGLKKFWNEHGDGIIEVFEKAWKTISETLEGALELADKLLSFVSDVFEGDWESAWANIKDAAVIATDSIVEAVQGVLDIIGKLYEMFSLNPKINAWIKEKTGLDLGGAWESGKETLNNIGTNFMSGISSTIDSIKDFAQNGISMDFSNENKTQYPTSKSLSSNEPDSSNITLEDLLRLGNLKTVSPNTLKSVTSSTTNKSINQEVNIQNTFSGSDRENQKQGAKVMGKSADDATNAMARSLAYLK